MIVRYVRLAVCAVVVAAASAACANPFVPHYEYEEQVYLSVDGRATVVIDSSLAALVALRGLPIDPSLSGATDRDGIRRVFAAAGCTVENVSRFWTRSGRRFVQVRVATRDVKQLPACAPLAWSSYALTPIEGGLRYQQQVGAAAAGDPGPVAWRGDELVAFKLHLPSRIRKHNVKLLDGTTNGDIERGNILTWAQTLADRRAGKPLAIDVEMDQTSILHTTLWIFAGAFAAAVGMLMLIIWLVIRKGRKGLARQA
jgi:hypothetical protein